MVDFPLFLTRHQAAFVFRRRLPGELLHNGCRFSGSHL